MCELAESVYLLDEATGSLHRMDMEWRTWLKRAPLADSVKCKGVSMTAARGRLYVAGGSDGICTCYDPATDTWSQCTPVTTVNDRVSNKRLSVQRWFMYGSLTQYGRGTLRLQQGITSSSSECLHSVEYNLDDDSWTEIEKLQKPAREQTTESHAVVIDM